MTRRSRLRGGPIAGLTIAVGLATAQFVAFAPAAHAVETQLSETGWVASSNTNSSSGDAART